MINRIFSPESHLRLSGELLLTTTWNHLEQLVDLSLLPLHL